MAGGLNASISQGGTCTRPSRAHQTSASCHHHRHVPDVGPCLTSSTPCDCLWIPARGARDRVRPHAGLLRDTYRRMCFINVRNSSLPAAFTPATGCATLCASPASTTALCRAMPCIPAAPTAAERGDCARGASAADREQHASPSRHAGAPETTSSTNTLQTCATVRRPTCVDGGGWRHKHWMSSAQDTPEAGGFCTRPQWRCAQRLLPRVRPLKSRRQTCMPRGGALQRAARRTRESSRR